MANCGEGFHGLDQRGQSRPLFTGHYQQHLPADLGFCALRLPEACAAGLARNYPESMGTTTERDRRIHEIYGGTSGGDVYERILLNETRYVERVGLMRLVYKTRAT
jgi:glycosyl transferase family WbsX